MDIKSIPTHRLKAELARRETERARLEDVKTAARIAKRKPISYAVAQGSDDGISTIFELYFHFVNGTHKTLSYTNQLNRTAFRVAYFPNLPELN